MESGWRGQLVGLRRIRFEAATRFGRANVGDDECFPLEVVQRRHHSTGESATLLVRVRRAARLCPAVVVPYPYRLHHMT